MRKCMKKAGCIALSLTMVLSYAGNVPPIEVRAEEQQQTNPMLKLKSLVMVTVDHGNQQTMDLFANGTYETKLNLEEGAHTIQVDVDGTLAETERSITLETAGIVYVRYQEGVLYDSVNNPEQFHTAALTGNFTGLEFVNDNAETYTIASWNPGDANAELEYLGGGLFKRTFTFKQLSEDLTIADEGYKVALDDDWKISYGDGGGNIALTIPGGSSSLTVYADTVNGKVYDSVRSNKVNITQNEGNIAESPFSMSVSLIGTVRCAGDSDWKVENADYDFRQIGEKLYAYQKTFTPGTYEYKVAFNHSKWYNKIDGNKKITVADTATNVMFVYDAETETIYDSINDNSKLSIMFGLEEEPIVSSVVNNANGTSTFVTTAAPDESAAVQLVYANLKTPEEKTTVSLKKQMNDQGEYKGTFTSEALYFGDDADDIIYYYVVNGNIVLDSFASSTTVDEVTYSLYHKEAFTGRLVCVPGTFPGKNWVASSNVMTYLGNGLYSYTFKNVPAANYNFKIAMGDWAENYGADGIPDGPNYAVTLTKTQDVTVYYNDITTHNAVTNVGYEFLDIDMSGSAIPSGTKLTDEGLTGTYSVTLKLSAGTYSDFAMTNHGKTYPVDSFTLDQEREVTFYFNPSMDVFYNNAAICEVNEASVLYDSKDINCKSVFGAVKEGEKVTFTIKTGDDVTKAQLKVRGKSDQSIDLAKNGDSWSGDLTINEFGEYQYFFVLYFGSSVRLYCDDDGYYGTGKLTDLNNLKPYDLIVYKAEFQTPDWMKDAVVYQIYPDRFFNGDTANDQAQKASRGETSYEFINDWYTLPENPEQEKLHPDTYPSNAFKGDGNFSNEIYGGDLKGITDRIDYLKALGVNVIYLNPVFSSISSHRYDTSDYKKIDPILGDMGDFAKLVKACEDNGMHLVLDGVFNHVADDSIYFDRYYKFVGQNGTVGAYPYWAYVYDEMAENGLTKENAEAAAKEYFKTKGVTDFSYTEWFTVNTTPLLGEDELPVQDHIGDRAGKNVYGYEGWWGYDSMPVIKSTEGSEFGTGNWGQQIIKGSDSVAQYWLSKGMNGWRLDVANEVSDETWQKFRESVKALNSDNVIIGEIWDDATKYILGDMYDSVMNYIFRNAVLSYAKGESAQNAMNTLEKIRERYPQEAYYAMMNLVGSHDTSRLLSYLDGINDDRKQTEIAEAFPSYETTSQVAKDRQYLVAFIQMTYPGAPTIYYGDELGMTGADDPDDRRGMIWGEGNKELVEWYSTLAGIRKAYPSLRTGTITPFNVKVDGNDSTNLMGYTRCDEDSKIIVVANNSNQNITATLNVNELLGGSVPTLTDVISGNVYEVSGSTIEVSVPAYKGVILTTKVNKVELNLEALKPGYDESFKIAKKDAQSTATPTPAPTSGVSSDYVPSTQTTPVPTQTPTSTPAPEKEDVKVEDGTLKECVVAKDGSVQLPASGKDTITSLDPTIFSNNKEIVSIDLSETKIDTIEATTFKNCTNLKKIVLPSTVKKIEAGAFRNCTSLASLKLPSSVESVSANVFTDCSKLTSITLERGFNGTINKKAFGNSSVTIYGYARTKAQIAAGVPSSQSIAKKLGVPYVNVKTSKVPQPSVTCKNSTIAAASKDKTVSYYQLWVWNANAKKYVYSASKSNGKFKVEKGQYRIVAVRTYDNGDQFRSKSSKTITVK